MRLYVENGWKRYLDDGYITWDNSLGNIEDLKNLLNNLHPSIRLTCDTHNEEMPFLDILLQRDSTRNRIITDIYHKNTDTFNYLPFNSCHPRP